MTGVESHLSTDNKQATDYYVGDKSKKWLHDAEVVSVEKHTPLSNIKKTNLFHSMICWNFKARFSRNRYLWRMQIKFWKFRSDLFFCAMQETLQRLPEVAIEPPKPGGHIVIFGCQSLSRLFADTWFELAVVVNLDFVTWITMILIFDPFLPRDAMQSAVYAVMRCLSVCLSVTFVHYILSKRIKSSKCIHYRLATPF